MLKTFWLNMRTSCLGRQVLEGGVVLGVKDDILYFVHFIYFYVYVYIYIIIYYTLGAPLLMYASVSVDVHVSV